VNWLLKAVKDPLFWIVIVCTVLVVTNPILRRLVINPHLKSALGFGSGLVGGLVYSLLRQHFYDDDDDGDETGDDS